MTLKELSAEYRASAIRTLAHIALQSGNANQDQIKELTTYLSDGAEPVGVEDRIFDLLNTIGVPCHIKGRRYLAEAITIAVNDPDVIDSITKELYPQVAKTFQTTPSRAERAIRHAIEIAWDRGDLDTLQRLFGYTVSNTKGKPTNSEFISLIANRIRRGQV